MRHISIESDASALLDQFRGTTLAQIRTLVIRYIFIDDTDLTIEGLRYVFPSVEYLHIGCVCSIEEIVDFLRRFKYLRTASFRYLRQHATNDERCRLYIQSTLSRMQGVKELNCTYRLDRSMAYFSISPPSKYHVKCNIVH